jgi:hypothetical protein
MPLNKYQNKRKVLLQNNVNHGHDVSSDSESSLSQLPLQAKKPDTEDGGEKREGPEKVYLKPQQEANAGAKNAAKTNKSSLFIHSSMRSSDCSKKLKEGFEKAVETQSQQSDILKDIRNRQFTSKARLQKTMKR